MQNVPVYITDFGISKKDHEEFLNDFSVGEKLIRIAI